MWWGKSVLNQKKIWNAKVGKNSSDIPRFGIDLQKPGLDMNRWEQMFWCLRKCWNNYWHGNSGVFVGFFPLPKFWLIWYIYIYSKVKGKNDWMKFKESYPFAYKNTQLRTVVTHTLHRKEGEVNVTHLSLGTCSGIAWTSLKRSTVSTSQNHWEKKWCCSFVQLWTYKSIVPQSSVFLCCRSKKNWKETKR